MESLLQDLTKAFGWSILNSVWQSGIIYAILFVILLSAPKLSAKVRHNLAYLAITAMFTWFLITFFGHIDFSDRPAMAARQDLSALGFYLSQFPETLSQKAEGYFPIIVSFYLIGIVIQLVVITRGYRFLKKLKTQQLSAVPDSWRNAFEQITVNLGLQRPIKFHLSELVNVPVVVGYLKPIVLFPVSLVTQLDNEQVEAILIHELSHIRRNDYLLNLIKTCIETLMFFNPFVWLASKFIHIEREHACDDLVLQHSGKPLTYAHALLKLELIKERATPAYALAATGKTQYLYQRIKRITNMKTNYLNTKQQMAALTLALAGLCSIAWTNPTVKEKTKEVTHKIAQTLSLTTSEPAPTTITLLADTSKKKTKMKIVITDDKGVTKEYSSIAELPDSLKRNFKALSFGGPGSIFAYSMTGDSSHFFKFDSLRHSFKLAGDKFATLGNLYTTIDGPAQKEKWEKFQKEMEKEFNSPEAKARWKKIGEDYQKQFDNPEFRAKWKKISEDMAKEFNSPEAKEKWKKFAEEMQKANRYQFRSFDSVFRTLPLAKMNWKSDSLHNLIYTTKLADLKNLKAGIYTLDSLAPSIRFNDRMFFSEDAEVRSSEEYKKLREQFEKDVEALKKKKKEEKKDTSKPAGKKVGYNIQTTSPGENIVIKGANEKLSLAGLQAFPKKPVYKNLLAQTGDGFTSNTLVTVSAGTQVIAPKGTTVLKVTSNN